MKNDDLVLDEVSKSGLADPVAKRNYDYLSTAARRGAPTGPQDRSSVLCFAGGSDRLGPVTSKRLRLSGTN